MIGIEAGLNEAEKIKKKMIEEGIYNREYKPIKNRDKIIFPLIRKPKNPERFRVAECDFEKISRNRYQDLLQEIPIDERESLPASYDFIGDIIIIDISGNEKYEKIIAEALLKANRQAKTVLKKAAIHGGEFRTQKLEFLAGERKKETLYRENNVKLMLDVEKVYFSPRLSTERKRIFSKIRKGENILVMFSGCGPYPLTISKNTAAKKITGVEKNPEAHRYGLINIELNKAKNVSLINGDVREIVPGMDEKFDRIIMPLPKDADTFLEEALMVAKKGTTLHLYGFEKEGELKKAEDKIKKEAEKSKIKYRIIETVKCGQYSPGKFRVCTDFILE